MILNLARPNEYEFVTNTVCEEYSMRMSFQKIVSFSFRRRFVLLMFVKVLVSSFVWWFECHRLRQNARQHIKHKTLR